MARKNFGNDRSRRRARFRQIFIQIRAILAIFRPFEVFTERPIVALVPMWLEFGGGTPSFLAHPLSLPELLLYMHSHLHIRTYVYVRMYVRMYVRTNVRTYVRAYVRMYVRMYVRAYVYMRVLVCTYVRPAL